MRKMCFTILYEDIRGASTWTNFRTRSPPPRPIFFIFMQFSGKFGRIINCHPTLVLAHPLGNPGSATGYASMYMKILQFILSFSCTFGSFKRLLRRSVTYVWVRVMVLTLHDFKHKTMTNVTNSVANTTFFYGEFYYPIQFHSQNW